MTSRDDAPLVRAAQAGDAASFGALFERHRARLHAVAVAMLGYGPDTDDAVQDTIVIALRRIGELRDPAAARAWLIAIEINVCRARLRRATHESPRSDLIDRCASIDTVQAAIDHSSLRDWVWTAIERLPEGQRLPVMLRHFSAASSYQAIAELCDIPIGTVRSRLNAGRRRLADELLSLASTAHSEREGPRQFSEAMGQGLLSFQQSGDPGGFAAAVTPDLRFRMADRIERQGRDELIAGLAHDFADGVTAQPLRVIPGEQVMIADLLLSSPVDKPLHCPPAVTQVYFHDGAQTYRLLCYYAPRSS
ncbi:MAG: RNA polymerase sigma factor [Microlunatus sp.]